MIITSTDGDFAAFVPIIRIFSEWTDVLKSHVATGTCRRVVRPGDVIGIYWAGDPGPASEKFYWRATVEEDGGYLYVASPDWPREPFHPREDWWVMLEQKSRKRRRGDDGLDDDDAQSSRVADAL